MLIIYFILAYLLGSMMAGFFVVKALGKKDIRVEGSGNVGARNAGRVHGRLSFVLTFLGDALKGAVVVVAGRYLGFSPEVTLIALGFAILGHLKPITLKFKGGMGISTFIGGMLAFDPIIAIILISGFLLLYPFLKSFTFAGLGSFIIIPFALYFINGNFNTSTLTAILVSIILYVHRQDINERLDRKTIVR
jgi:acyl phosphate:glycerol-3-phosphate acyltransferase